MIENAESLQAALETLFGPAAGITERRAVSGGDINAAFLLSLKDGHRVFLKENSSRLAGMFAAEAVGLQALAEISGSSDSPPVPEPLAWGVDANRAFLLMEAVIPSRERVDGRAFGRSLAILHREGRRNTPGFDTDNWIGSTPQPNDTVAGWHEFFALRRLEYQWDLARGKGYGDRESDRRLHSICNRLPELLPDLDDSMASLLHGDLWGGNWMNGAGGRAWLIDPAVYYGHRESDLAMTRLFGGFPAGFHQGYTDQWPLEPGFEDRVDLYNLYHLLNHLNLFGGSYLGGVIGILNRYG